MYGLVQLQLQESCNETGINLQLNLLLHSPVVVLCGSSSTDLSFTLRFSNNVVVFFILELNIIF